MSDPFADLKQKSAYEAKPTIKAPTPPPLNESLMEMIQRRLNQTVGPIFDQADAAVRNAGNRASVGLTDVLERTFGAPGVEDTAKHTQEALTKFPEASAVGGAGGTVLQAMPISRAFGAVGALGRPTFGAQVANQAATGATQSAIQQAYEANRDDQPINPAKFAGGVVLGGILGGAGGAGASVLGRGTPSGIVARTIPRGLPTAERTALAKAIQRGENAGFNPDIAEAARASERPELVERVAPILERQIRRGGETLPGEELPVHMTAHQAARHAPGGYFHRKGEATANLTKVEDDIAAATAANARAEAANQAANVPGPRAGPQPREAGKFSRSPEGPVMPESRVPIPDSSAARSEVEKFKAFLDLEKAAANRPALPEAPGPVRPRSFTAGIPGVGNFTYRGGKPQVGPTAGEVGAAEIMQKQPQVAAGLLGKTPFGETAGGALPSALLRDPLVWLAMQGLGMHPR